MPLRRDQIARIVGNDPRAIREFERLLTDVQGNITGLTSITLNYSSTGSLITPLPAQFSYQLSLSDGTVARSGISWGVTVLSGTFSGAAPTIGGTGTGVLQINSGITSPTVVIAITARGSGRGYPAFQVMIQRTVGAADGGSGGLTASDTTATLATFSTSAFVALTRDLVITTPAGVTVATLTAPLISLSVASEGPSGDIVVEMKWQRETAPSVWTDIGAVATSSPSPTVTEFTEDIFSYFSASSGSTTCNRTETGLTAATQYTYRLVARISSGNLRDVLPEGAASVTS